MSPLKQACSKGRFIHYNGKKVVAKSSSKCSPEVLKTSPAWSVTPQTMLVSAGREESYLTLHHSHSPAWWQHFSKVKDLTLTHAACQGF